MVELIREDAGAGLAIVGTAKDLGELRKLIGKAEIGGASEKIKIKNTVGAKIDFRFSSAGYKPEAEGIDDLLS